MIEDLIQRPPRKPEELLADLETCRGPCWDICIRCREAYHLGEIYKTLKALIEENKELKEQLNKK